MDHGSVFRRCGCRDQTTGRLLGVRCPKLRSARARVMVFQRGSAVGRRGAAAGAPRRVHDQGGGGRGAGGAVRPGAGRGAGADDGGVAGPVAGLSGVAACLDQPRVCRPRARLPGPVPGRHPAGRAVARRRAADVQRDHPRRGGAGTAGECGDAAPHPRHAAGGAERRGPGRAAHLQPGPVARVACCRPAAAAGVDPRADRALAAGGVAAGGRGVDRRADRRVPGAGARSPAVCAVPPGRTARAAPR